MKIERKIKNLIMEQGSYTFKIFLPFCTTFQGLFELRQSITFSTTFKLIIRNQEKSPIFSNVDFKIFQDLDKFSRI